MTSLAKEIFAEDPNILSEDRVLGLGFERLRQQRGLKSARYYFLYDEDFRSDYVSEYFWLQQHAQIGVDQ